MAVLRVMQNSLDEAYRLFTELKTDAQDWRQRTYASSWLLRISKMRKTQSQLANCGNKALSDILAKRGNTNASQRVAALNVENPQGYSLNGLRELAAQHGLAAQALHLNVSQLPLIELPAIVQIDRSDVNGLGHYWEIEAITENQITIYDAQKFRRFEQSLNEFAREWSGKDLMMTRPPKYSEVAVGYKDQKQIWVTPVAAAV
jgi:ABC-type bacteriocin/lantibiotic exporter with double-glycine peptidase domain